MNILVEVKDNKAEVFLEFLKSIPFVKAKSLTPEKAQVLKELKEAVDNLNLVKAGKLKAKPAKDLLREL